MTKLGSIFILLHLPYAVHSSSPNNFQMVKVLVYTYFHVKVLSMILVLLNKDHKNLYLAVAALNIKFRHCSLEKSMTQAAVVFINAALTNGQYFPYSNNIIIRCINLKETFAHVT